MKTAVLLAVAALAILTGGANAQISCYVCDSDLDTGCTELSFQVSSATPTSGCTACTKSVVSVSVLGLSSTTVSRSCDVACTPGSSDVAGLGSVNNYCCSSNLCNGATSMKLTRTTLALALTFVVLAFFNRYF